MTVPMNGHFKLYIRYEPNTIEDLDFWAHLTRPAREQSLEREAREEDDSTAARYHALLK